MVSLQLEWVWPTTDVCGSPVTAWSHLAYYDFPHGWIKATLYWITTASNFVLRNPDVQHEAAEHTLPDPTAIGRENSSFGSGHRRALSSAKLKDS